MELQHLAEVSRNEAIVFGHRLRPRLLERVADLDRAGSTRRALRRAMGEADTGEPISEWRRGLQADVPCAVWLLAAAKKEGPSKPSRFSAWDLWPAPERRIVYSPFTSIFLTDFCASAVFGSTTVRTPFLKLAPILSTSTVSGTLSARSNEPKRRSLMRKSSFFSSFSSRFSPLMCMTPLDTLTSMSFSSIPGRSAWTS